MKLGATVRRWNLDNEIELERIEVLLRRWANVLCGLLEAWRVEERGNLGMVCQVKNISTKGERAGDQSAMALLEAFYPAGHYVVLANVDAPWQDAL